MGELPDIGANEFLYILDPSRRHSIFSESINPDMDSNVTVPFFNKTSEEAQKLTEETSGILAFKGLDSDQIQEVVNAMADIKVKCGDWVFKQGDEGDSFYVIQDGIFEMSKEELGKSKVLQRLENKGHFGEIALLYNMPRTCSVAALSDGSLWRMDRVTFRKIVVNGAFRKRKFYDEALSSVPMFRVLDTTEKNKLSDTLDTKIFKDGEVVFRVGDKAGGMFFVESGSVLVKEGNENGTVLSVLKKGDHFGEISVMPEENRNAYIASGSVRLAFLQTDCFERLLGSCKDIMKRKFN
ncbi:cAMP-dependent protein kinase type II regulatory subunit-like [Cimex lectularius]|uniref:Cyclic nucleotide-binding domain-containing protein n=1 Tax=Cimex lectularius TaxID=79782 RepID=A0A8I6SCY7_CIMLE|nr:cAMP-dependent protein kinase type II regulatory subunit-like [Cimex lectularius]